MNIMYQEQKKGEIADGRKRIFNNNFRKNHADFGKEKVL